jgi:hypothetical protein
METKNREKLLLIGAGVVIALWLLDTVVISPLIDSWHSRSQEIAGLKEKIANGWSLSRRGEMIGARWDEMRANALANDVPVAERQLFTAFDHWVKVGDVAQGSFHPQPQEGDSNFTTIDWRSDVSGSLPDVANFLRAMSKDPLANKVDSFELTSKDDNGRQLTLALGLSGLILTGSDPSTVTVALKSAELPAPQGTNLAASADMDPFRLITRNNIFDQSRIYRGERSGPIVPVRRFETITCKGASLDNGSGSAWFAGNGISESHEYKVGDSIDGLMIAKITLNTVTVTNAGTNTFVLPTDSIQSLRREEDGPWRPTGYTAALPSADANTNVTSSVSAAPASGSAADDVIARLKKKREQE